MNTHAPAPNPAALGDLALARDGLARGDLQTSWAACVQAVRERPFHPEAMLLAAQIALAAQDLKTARACMDRARQMAPKLADAHSLAIPTDDSDRTSSWPGLSELTETHSPRLTICMIVKDEEAFLAKCLQSVRPIAHQVVVVDTGSTDHTVEIAREHGAEVYFHPWNDDFSAARNAAMVHARGDWVLCLDADEELTPGAGAQLLNEIANPAVIAYELPLVNEGREEEGAVYLPRLFRNVPGASYQGRVHEQIVEGLVQRTQGWGLEARTSQAVLLHHGYSREVTASRNKPQRNLRLLQKSLENPPVDPLARAYLLTNLGLETARTGDIPGGIAHYERALELLNQVVESKGSLAISPEFRAAFLKQFAPYLNRVGRFADIIKLYRTPLARGGEMSASDHYSLGLALGQAAQFEPAAREFRACLAKRRAPTRVPNHSIVLGHAPFQCLASALSQLNLHGEAEKTYQQGLADLPQSVELRLEYARFKLQRGRVLEALKETHALVNEHSGNPAVWILGAEICLANPQFREIAMDWTAAALERHPADAAIAGLRVEALLTAGAVDAALTVFSTPPLSASLNERTLATVIFCRLLTGSEALPSVDARVEPRTSQAFLDLYRRVGLAGGTAVTQRVKSNIARLQSTLPLAHKAITQIS